MSGHKAETKRNTAIDGLRFFAITLVIASHTGVLFQGGLGNDIFFCLSGFLCISPFVENAEQRYLSVKETGRYYLSRVLRIIPTFWVCLFFATAFFQDYFYVRDVESESSLLLNMLFIKNRGHLWFLQQEMMFYVVAPVFFLLLGFVKRGLLKKLQRQAVVDAICFLLVTALAFAAIKCLSADVFHLHANGGRQFFRLGYFLVGMSFSYLYRAYAESGWKFFDGRLGRLIANAGVLAFLVFCIASSRVFLERINPELSEYYIGWEKPTLCVYLTGITLFLLLVCPDSVLCKVLGNPLFSRIGGVSFIMYLIHFFFITRLTSRSPVFTFMFVYIVSLSLALVIHELVEKPSIRFSRDLSFRGLLDYYKSL